MKNLATFLAISALSLGLVLSAEDSSAPALSKLSSANDDFGLRVLQALEAVEHQKSVQSRGNVFISPFSIHSVLSMLLAGGAEKTYEQIYDTLG